MTYNYEIITDNELWWVVNVWYLKTFTTKLFEKEEETFSDVLEWIKQKEQR